MIRRLRLARACALAALTFVVACGVGGEGTGARPESVSIGTIDGLGPLNLSGQAVDEGTSSVVLELDPTQAQAIPASQLRLGMQAAAVLNSDGKAVQLIVLPSVAGPVEAVNVGDHELRVAGQVVRIDATPAERTLFDGLNQLSDLQIGDWIQVHGSRATGGQINATFVGRIAPMPGVRVAGPIKSLSSGEARFDIGGLSVDYASLGQQSTAGLAQSGYATVFGSLQNGRLRASAIRPVLIELASEATIRIGGRIASSGRPGEFQIGGVRLIARDTAVDGGLDGSLVDGTNVLVSGRAVSGVLSSARASILADSNRKLVAIRGEVASFASISDFKLRGTLVNGSTAKFTQLQASNVGNGVPVLLRGEIGAGRLVAQTVDAVIGDPTDVEVSVGEISETQLATRRFKLIGLEPQFRLANDVKFVGGDISGWGDGVRVEIRSRAEGAERLVTQLRFLTSASTTPLDGVVLDVQPQSQAGRFRIDAVEVVWDNATEFLGPTNSSQDVRRGVFARTALRTESGILIANRVDLRQFPAGVVVVRGTVTDFLSIADFRVEGQRIDASRAMVEPRELLEGLAGAFVEIEGTLVDGKLVATRVRGDS